MCLAVPMIIRELRGDGTAVAELDGVPSDVNILLVPDVKVGTYVVVHAGFAIERMNKHEADAILEVFKEIAEWQKSAAESAPGAVP